VAELAPLTHKFAKRSCVGTFRNERTRSTPLDPKLMFCGVSDRFVTAGKSKQNWTNWHHKCISSLNKVELEIFHNERTRSIPFDPKLYLGPFCYCTKLDAKQPEHAPLTHKFSKRRCVGTFRNERSRSTPLDPKLMFWGISDHFVPFRKSMENWPN
jgi:hypothetical protein